MTRSADVLVIGGGIAGASVAAEIAASAKVIVLEMEDRPGYHATGRSAALWEPTYGPPAIRSLTLASGAFLREPPKGFVEVPLVTPRGVVMLVLPGDEELADDALASGFVEISEAEALRLHPAIRRGKAWRYLHDSETADVDVDALHAGTLRRLRRQGGEVVCKARVSRGTPQDGGWVVETNAGPFRAPLVVNAAGAWADEVAAGCGLSRIGLVPKRRSAAVLPPPAGYDITHWPQIFPAREPFYCKPMSGKLMLSPADATPVEPHDAFADDMRIAEAVAAMEECLDITVTRVEHTWGGLRTFAPDGDPVVGYDPRANGFFWLAGQGGYGVQTAPALSRLAAAMVLGRPADSELAGQKKLIAQLSPERFIS